MHINNTLFRNSHDGILSPATSIIRSNYFYQNGEWDDLRHISGLRCERMRLKVDGIIAQRCRGDSWQRVHYQKTELASWLAQCPLLANGIEV